MKRLSALCPLVVAAISLLSLSALADNDMRSVVHSSNGQVVTNTFDQCVRTRWSANEDECAPFVVKEQVVETKRNRTAVGVEQRTVYFAFDKADLTGDAQAKLDSLTAVLRSANDVKNVHIVGYADRIGSADYNNRLSHARAEKVRNYIVGHGYANVNVAETRWVGKSSPVTNCPKKMKRPHLINCLQADRRVVVELDYVQRVSNNK